MNDVGQSYRASVKAQRALKIAVITSLAGVAVAGLAANFHSPYWLDEIYTGAMACQPDFYSSAAITSRDVHPPTYVILVHALFSLFGCRMDVVRILSVLCSAVGAAFLFLTIRRRRLDTLLGATLLFASPAFWYFTVEARSYAMLFMSTCGVLYFGSTPTRRSQLLGLCMALFGALINFFGGYLFLLAGWLLYRQWRSFTAAEKLVLSGAWMLALLVVGAVYLRQYHYVQMMLPTMWIPRPELAALLKFPMFLIGGSLFASVTVATLVVLVIARAPKVAYSFREPSMAMLVLFLGFVLGLFVVSYLRPMFVNRYAYFLFPLLILWLLELNKKAANSLHGSSRVDSLERLAVPSLCLVLLLAEFHSTCQTFQSLRPLSWQRAAESMQCAVGRPCLFVLDAPMLRSTDDEQYSAIANYFHPQSGAFRAVRPENLDAAIADGESDQILYLQSYRPLLAIDERTQFLTGLCVDQRKNKLGAVFCHL